MKQIKDYIIFIVKLLVVLTIAYGLYNLLFWYLWLWDKGPNAYDESYQRALLYQYDTIADSEREPMIIFYGPSYVPYGIDADVISEYTGLRAQIFGTEVSVGDAFLTESLKNIAKEGDVLVYVLGPTGLYREDFMTVTASIEGDRELLMAYWQQNEGNVANLKSKLMWRKLYSLIMGNPVEYVRSKISTKEQAYSIYSFDDYGNMTLQRDGTRIDTNISPFDRVYFEDIDIARLDNCNEFASWCSENGITLLVTYQPFILGSLINDDDEITQYCNQISEYVNADVISSQQECLFPVEYFYNTIYHLNTEGAKAYSVVLGQALYDYFNKD